MRSLSHREYEARLEWINQQWNNPDRSDNYLMLLAQEVWMQRHPGKKPPVLEKFRINFTRKEGTGDDGEPKEDADASTKEGWLPRTAKEAARIAKARWFMVTGYKPKKPRTDE